MKGEARAETRWAGNGERGTGNGESKVMNKLTVFALLLIERHIMSYLVSPRLTSSHLVSPRFASRRDGRRVGAKLWWGRGARCSQSHSRSHVGTRRRTWRKIEENAERLKRKCQTLPRLGARPREILRVDSARRYHHPAPTASPASSTPLPACEHRSHEGRGGNVGKARGVVGKRCEDGRNVVSKPHVT